MDNNGICGYSYSQQCMVCVNMNVHNNKVRKLCLKAREVAQGCCSPPPINYPLAVIHRNNITKTTNKQLDWKKGNQTLPCRPRPRLVR